MHSNQANCNHQHQSHAESLAVTVLARTKQLLSKYLPQHHDVLNQVAFLQAQDIWGPEINYLLLKARKAVALF
jgi:hypothetical protein